MFLLPLHSEAGYATASHASTSKYRERFLHCQASAYVQTQRTVCACQARMQARMRTSGHSLFKFIKSSPKMEIHMSLVNIRYGKSAGTIVEMILKSVFSHRAWSDEPSASRSHVFIIRDAAHCRIPRSYEIFTIKHSERTRQLSFLAANT